MGLYDNVVEFEELKAGKIFYIVDIDNKEVVKAVYTGRIKDNWGVVLRSASVVNKSKTYVISRSYIYRSHEEAEERLAKVINDLVNVEKAGLVNTRELADYAKRHLDNDDEIVDRAIIERVLELNLDLKKIVSELWDD